MTGEVEKRWQILDRTIWMTRIREPSRRLSKLIKEWVHHGING